MPAVAQTSIEDHFRGKREREQGEEIRHRWQGGCRAGKVHGGNPHSAGERAEDRDRDDAQPIQPGGTPEAIQPWRPKASGEEERAAERGKEHRELHRGLGTEIARRSGHEERSQRGEHDGGAPERRDPDPAEAFEQPRPPVGALADAGDLLRGDPGPAASR